MGILDVPAAQRQRPSLFMGLPVVTNKNNQFDIAGSASNGTDTSGNSRIMHVFRVSCTDVRLVYNNYSTGADGANPITVEAAVEVPTTGYTSFASIGASGVLPVYFGGQTSVTIPPGGVAISDPIPVTANAGDKFYSRTYVSVSAAGMKWPTGLFSAYYSDTSNEGFDSGAPAVKKLAASTTSTIPSTTGRTYSPCAVIGAPQSASTKSRYLALVGDSVMFGSGDSYPDLGWGSRAADLAGLPYINVAIPGEASTGFTVFGARHRLSLIASATEAIVEYGRNDFNTSPTVATVQSNLIAAWKMLAARQIRVRQTTITPRCTSTDGFTTLANQTILNAGTQEVGRVALNAWIRDGAPITSATGVAAAVGASGSTVIRAGQDGHPLVGWLEVTDTVESARDSGKWKLPNRVVTDAAISLSSPSILTSASAAFTSADVGRSVNIMGAGSGGAVMQSVITAVTNATTVILLQLAATAVSGAIAGVGVYCHDGLHPSTTGHRAIADGVTLAA